MPSTIEAAVRDRRYAQLVEILDDSHIKLDDDSVIQFAGERYACVQIDSWELDTAVIFHDDPVKAVEHASTELLEGDQPSRLYDLDTGQEVGFNLDYSVQVRVDQGQEPRA